MLQNLSAKFTSKDTNQKMEIQPDEEPQDSVLFVV